MYKVIRNTYPKYASVAHAEVGDIVEWQLMRGNYCLIRKSDNKTVFGIGGVDKNGLLRSTKKQPKLIGIIARMKSKGWVLEIAKLEE